jgi:hypothetical protein
VVTAGETAVAVEAAGTWNTRVALIRRIPEEYGQALQPDVYAAVATRVYSPSIAPDFAYVHWRSEYELDRVEAAYALAHAATDGFRRVSPAELEVVLLAHPTTAQIFRLILGLTSSELAETCKLAPEVPAPATIGKGTITSMEAGRCPSWQWREL